MRLIVHLGLLIAVSGCGSAYVGSVALGHTVSDSSLRLRRAALEAVEEYEAVAYYFRPAGDTCIASDAESRCFRGRSIPCVHCQPVLPDWYVRTREAILLETLDSLSMIAPADSFIVGHRAYYHLKALHKGQSLAAAAECAVGIPYCARLEGYVLSELGRTVEAERAFARALSLLSEDERCDMLSLRVGALGDSIASEDTVEQHGSCDLLAAERMWFLADPSYLLPGNDRRNAHLSRAMEYEFFLMWGQERGRSEDFGRLLRFTYPSLRDTVLREGWNDSWRKVSNTMQCRQMTPAELRRTTLASGSQTCGVPMCARHITHTSPFSNDNPAPGRIRPRPTANSCGQAWNELSIYSFVPDLAAQASPFETGRQAWDPLRHDAAEWYSPTYSPVSSLVDYQIGFFLRGDSAQMVVVADASRDSLIEARRTIAPPDVRRLVVNDSADLGNIETTRWNVGLALLDSAAVRQRQVSALFLQRLDSLPPHVRFTVPAGVSPHLVSLEIFPPGVASMTRLRAGVSPPMTGDSGLSLSDILLVLPDSSHTVPAFEDAVSRAIPRSWVRTSESIGLYWELYGARAGDSVAVQLVARSESGESGWLRRLASSVLGSSALAATAVQWQAEVPTDKADSAPHSDGLVLDFSGLAPGLYRFELSITISDGRHALVTRAVEVRR